MRTFGTGQRRASRAPGAPSALITFVLFAAGALVANGLAFLAVYEPALTLPGLVALVAVPAAVLRPRLVAYLLIVTMFAPALSIGGVTIGRVTAPIALVALLALLVREPPSLRSSKPLLLLAGGYVTLAAASVLWSVDVSSTVEEFTTLVTSIVYMGVIVLAVRTEDHLKTLTRVLVASSVVMGLYWIGSYLLDVDRRYNETGDPNFFAALQVMALPIALAVSLRMDSERWRRPLLFGAAVIAGSVVATLSRGGLVTLLLVFVLLLIMPARMLFGSSRRKWTLVTACLLGLALLLPIAWSDLNRRVAVTVQEADLAGERGDLWRAATAAYFQHPVTGLGYGGFRATSFQLLRTTPGVDLVPHLRFVSSGEYVHNAYLGSLAELGPLGLALFLGIVVAMGRALARITRAQRDSFVVSIAAATLMGVAGMALSSLTLSTETSRMFWFLVGLTVVLRNLSAQGVPANEEPSVAPLVSRP